MEQPPFSINKSAKSLSYLRFCLFVLNCYCSGSQPLAFLPQSQFYLNVVKISNFSAVEFMRRFLMHILPTGLTKIRHYGFLGNRKKNTKLRLCQKLTGGKLKPLEKRKLTAAEIILKITGRDITKCSCCGHSKLHSQYSFGNSNAPPIMPLSKQNPTSSLFIGEGETVFIYTTVAFICT